MTQYYITCLKNLKIITVFSSVCNVALPQQTFDLNFASDIVLIVNDYKILHYNRMYFYNAYIFAY